MPEDPEWRGRISSDVANHERRLNDLNGDVRAIRNQLVTMGTDLVKLQGSVDDLSNEIDKAARELQQNRNRDYEELKEVAAEMSARQLKGKDLVAYVLAPLFVLIVSGLIIFALTHGA